jgi:chloramphenicol O-acetyltransferase type A
MRTIDLQSWPRKEHFETFLGAHYPHFNICADVDVTETRRAARQRAVPITAAIVYVTTRAANDIPEFRLRIRGQTVVEHDIVHPATTVMVNGGLFTFGFFDYTEDFPVFVKHYDEMTAFAKANPTLEDPPGRDDLLFMTAIPWVSFSSFSHPIITIPVDSIPRIAWGRFRQEDGSLKMPLSVQGHHSLMDGLHVGRFFEEVQSYLRDSEAFMGDS